MNLFILGERELMLFFFLLRGLGIGHQPSLPQETSQSSWLDDILKSGHVSRHELDIGIIGAFVCKAAPPKHFASSYFEICLKLILFDASCFPRNFVVIFRCVEVVGCCGAASPFRIVHCLWCVAAFIHHTADC